MPDLIIPEDISYSVLLLQNYTSFLSRVGAHADVVNIWFLFILILGFSKTRGKVDYIYDSYFGWNVSAGNVRYLQCKSLSISPGYISFNLIFIDVLRLGLTVLK